MDRALPPPLTLLSNPTKAELSGTEADFPKPQHLILLVDDEPMIRQLFGQTLLRCGYRVLLAKDGEEALALYRSRKCEIALVILDLTMPRLSGMETLKQLIAIDAEVRVLLSSGSMPDLDLEKGCRQVVGFLNKPYRAEQIATQLAAVLTSAAKVDRTEIKE